MSLETKLNKYAELIVKKGVNVQPGQTIILYAAVDEAYFARKIVAEAYKAGAHEVVMEWSDQTIAKEFLNQLSIKIIHVLISIVQIRLIHLAHNKLIVNFCQ